MQAGKNHKKKTFVLARASYRTQEDQNLGKVKKAPVFSLCELCVLK